MSKPKPKTATLKLTEREWWLLKNGFDQSFIETGDPDSAELAAISGKVTDAWIEARK